MKLSFVFGMIGFTAYFVIEREEQVRFDRTHFKAYGDFNLISEMVYYIFNCP